MLSIKSLVLIIGNVVAISECITLPSYIAQCSLSDANLNGCIKEHANLALPTIVKGDKERKIPPLSPYSISKIEINAGNNLKIGFTDATITGLEKVEILDAKMDLKEGVIKFKATTPKAALSGNYKMDGRILVLPITGEGKGIISFENVICHYTLNYELPKKDDGKVYFHVAETQLDFDAEKTHYEFENLFNGDKTLGAEMHKFLNENYKEVGKELNPGYAKVIEAIVNNVVKAYTEDLLHEDVFKH